MTPSDPERLTEPLTAANVELIYEHTGERHDPACPFVVEYGQVSPNVCTCPHIVGQWDSHDKMQATIDSLTTRLAAAEERASFWETLHDERTESLEAERDKALKMRDYWYAEFKRTVDPVNNPHRCSSECADNPTCPAIRAYDQDATDAGYQLCDCGHFHRPRTDCGNWWFYPDVRTGRACGCTEWRKPR